MAFETFKHNLLDCKNSHFDWPAWLKVKKLTIQTLLKTYPDEIAQLMGKVDLIAGQGFHPDH